MNKCKTCKFWEEEYWDETQYDPIRHPIDPDTLELMPTNFEVRLCKSSKIAYFERHPESNGISLVDGSDYLALMLTGEDFGCVNWQKKTKGENHAK
jgi:hypothetical protein